MCEPVTITAIVTSTAVAVEAAAAAAATAAAAAASAIAGAATSAAAAIGIGGGAAGGAGLSGGLAGSVGGGVATGTGSTALTIGAGTLAETGSVLSAGLSAAAPTASTGLTIADGIALASLAAGVGGGIASGVKAEQQREAAKKLNKKDVHSKTVAALNARQQGAEASAKQQFQASRAALAAAGRVKASNLGERSVAALSRAVGFELGTDKATIKRNQQIANLETSARLFGIGVSGEARRNLIGETGGLTLSLNTGTSFLNAGARALQIRNALSN